MHATLPVRTWNITSMGLVALMLATIVVFGAAMAFGASRALPAAVDQPAAQTIEQSVVNHAIDERTDDFGLTTPVSTYPLPDDKIGSRNLAEPKVVAPAAEPGARNRVVNVPQ